MAPPSVRRNLFQGNLSRRPAPPGPSNGTVLPGNNGLTNRPSNRLRPTLSDASSSSSRSIKLAENKDIVVRDKNGGYKLDMPALPRSSLPGDEDLDELEDETGESHFEPLDSEREKESIVANPSRSILWPFELTEMYRVRDCLGRYDDSP